MQTNRLGITKNILLVIFGGFILNQANAVNSKPIVEGVDYTILSTPVPATGEPKGKVNVKEFFSFSCIHCKDIDPMVENTLVPNKKVDLDKIQVVWDANTSNFAKLNATIVLMKLNKLYTPAFNAVFSRQDLNDPKVLKSFLLANGLTDDQANKFIATYNSFTVSSKVSEYKTMSTTYNITGTPTFIVADKYVASPALPDKLIDVVQQLVVKAANEKK